jgi:hypothetical protein
MGQKKKQSRRDKMKKLIAASAALLLVGSAVAASAEVTFTGDARERLILQRNYDFGTYGQQSDYNTGRVRIVVNAVTKGGAYANLRLRFADTKYDTEMANTSLNGNSVTGGDRRGTASDYYTDWAYLGIPIGPVTINAGLMPDITTLWFRYDKRFDRVAVTYANKMTSVSGMFDKMQEASLDNYGKYATVQTQDRDLNQWDLVVKQKFAGNWEMIAAGIYQDNQRADWSAKQSGSGFLGTIQAKGPAGPVKLLAELSYKEQDVNDGSYLNSNHNQDYGNGYGGILHAQMQFGPASGTLIAGFTKDGFRADSNYGFLMMGGAMAGDGRDGVDYGVIGSPIQAMGQIGTYKIGSTTIAANTFFTGLVGTYKVSNTIRLVGDLAYANMDNFGSMVELAGLVRFDVTEGAYISVGAGMLAPSVDSYYKALGVRDDNAYGAFTELGIKF